MKYILKLIIGTCFLPFLILGGIIAVVRTLFVITFIFAWEQGEEWHGKLICKMSDFMQWVNK